MSQPLDPVARQRAWEEAERRGQSERLLELRELEQAIAALPTQAGLARRGRLLAWDRISTTWEAWELHSGRRRMQRHLHPAWRGDPVVLRLFEQAIAEAPGERPDPYTLCQEAPGLPLAELLPVEDPPSTRALAALFAAGLGALVALEARGRSHGGPVPVCFLIQTSGPVLHHLGQRVPAPAPGEDLRQLSALVAAFDPQGHEPLAGLARSWIQDPPASALDAQRLFISQLAQTLAAARHGLFLAARGAGRRARASALLRAARALSATPPPPLARSVLAQLPEGGTLEIESDGHTVRAGLGSAEELGLVWRGDRGLDAPAARTLLRAWATGGSLGAADPLMRWLAAAASLRRARLLLEHQSQGPTARR